MKLFKIYLIVVFGALISCSTHDNENFSLTVKHYAGGAGITIIYLIDKTGLQIDTNCDLSDCKEAIVYKRIFSDAESDSIISVLNSLQLDTLKPSYQYQGYYDDGFFTEVKLRRGVFSTHKSTFANIYTPTADSLNAYIDKLVTKKEFRISTWGQTQ